MNSTIYIFKSIPTKDKQFPQLPKCFEMEFGPQKCRVLAPLYPPLSFSRLGGGGGRGGGGGVQIFSFGQEGGGVVKKLCMIWGRCLKIWPI